MRHSMRWSPLGVILHDGELPAGGVQACVDALDGLG